MVGVRKLPEKMPVIIEIPYRQPVPVFAPFAEDSGAVLLDSAKESAGLGRYSYIALDPFSLLCSKNGRVEFHGEVTRQDPWLLLQQQLAVLKTERVEGLPLLQGGAVGFFSYDLGRHCENLPEIAEDDIEFPDMVVGFYDVIVSFDHVLKKAWIVSTGLPESDPIARAQRAQARMQQWQERLSEQMPLQPLSSIFAASDAIESNFTAAAYQQAVQRVIDAILAGDIFEANISQRFSAALPAELKPFELYCRLRVGNPAPFASYLNFDEVVIASASPERFLRLSAKEVETRPIKGTAPRYADKELDRASAESLMASEKDHAENVMIVDLMRNDLSRVCEDYSVKVPALCGLESFETVHHLVSVVTATLCADRDAVDLLRVAFPGGSITGAPKVRAMELIEEIEPHRRGPYCGSVGFISFTGDMDTAITIRTYAIKNQRVIFQAGGAVVMDSVPAAEYQETLDKAAALRAALVG